MKPVDSFLLPELTSHCSPVVRNILQQHGNRSLPLTASQAAALETSLFPEIDSLLTTPAPTLCPDTRSPQGALSGLLLLLNDWHGSHRMSQDLHTPEGSYWHGVAHRMEPDSFNAAYWFRRVGSHPIFPALHQHAAVILESNPDLPWRLKSQWDPFLFIEWCDAARHSSGRSFEQAALAIQKVEWTLLFAWCSQAAQ